MSHFHETINTQSTYVFKENDFDETYFMKKLMDKFLSKANNRGHNILRLFDVLANFIFTISETKRDYYLQTWYIRVTSRVAEQIKTYEIRKYQENLRTS